MERQSFLASLTHSATLLLVSAWHSCFNHMYKPKHTKPIKLLSVWARLCGLVIALLFMPNAYAKQELLPQLKFSHIAKNALESMGQINDIAQDNEGYLWFAAEKGLARYNGYDLIPFRYRSGQPGIAANWVEQLLITQSGQLWLTTRDGFCRFNSPMQQFTCSEITQSADGEQATYHVLFEDSQNRLWLSSNLGLYQINTKTLVTQKPKSAWLDTNTQGESYVTAITEDKSGHLWLGHFNSGLSRYSPASGKGINWQQGQNGLQSNKIRTLMLDDHDRLWIGTHGTGIFLFDIHRKIAKPFSHNVLEKSDTVWHIYQDRRGLIWIGDGTGVHVVSSVDLSVESHRYEESQAYSPGNFVARSIYEDNTGGIWIGYFPSGVDRIDEQGSQFVTHHHDAKDPLSLPDGGVLSTLEDNSGNIWVGAGLGLGYLDRSSETFTQFSHDPYNTDSLSGSTILAMTYGNNQELWLGIWDRGLNRRDPKTGKFHHYLPQPGNPHSLMGREPWGLLFDSKQRLWVATEKGISLYRPDTDDFQRYLPKDAKGNYIGSLYTRNIYEDKQGVLWVASFSGLYKLDPVNGDFKGFLHDPNNFRSISSNMVSSILEDSQGRLWIGTDGAGLNLFDRKTSQFKRFGEEDGLADQSISSIVEDVKGNLWLATFQGLVMFNPDDEIFKHYHRTHGLPGNLFNRNSGSRLSTGELIFGSTEGLVIFNPSQLMADSLPPKIAFTDFRIFNHSIQVGDDTKVLVQDINHTQHITLNHLQSVFSISFAALDYRSPEDNQYAYRLIGFEKDWNWVEDQHSATYTNLDPGEYQFEVKAANSSGIWNNEPKTINITIVPPPWLSLWAKIFYAALFLGTLLIIYFSQTQRLENTRLKLERERELVTKLREVERMKDNINRELDLKVAQRTEELNREKELLLEAHQQLAQLNEKLESITVTDQLTGLNNRRYLDQFIYEDIALVRRKFSTGLPKENTSGLVFVILDLDSFKSVNDTYGHDAGDKILVQLADVFKRVLRQSDYIVRWGGEEFVIVMRQLKREDVELSVERLRAAIEETPFDIGRDSPVYKTASIGFASYPFHPQFVDALSWEQVIGIADRALYGVKRSGKNGWIGISYKDEDCRKGEVIDLAYENHLLEQLKNNQLKVVSNKDVELLNWG